MKYLAFTTVVIMFLGMFFFVINKQNARRPNIVERKIIVERPVPVEVAPAVPIPVRPTPPNPIFNLDLRFNENRNRK